MKVVHFGAGNIGRGFIGEVLHDNGAKICFVDVDEALIEQLNKNQKYYVQLIDDKKTRFTVNNVSAVNSLTDKNKVIEEIQEADMITTSIGAANFNKISQLLSEALVKRVEVKKSPLDIIANENANQATNLLREEIKKQTVSDQWKRVLSATGFVNATVDRQAMDITENNQKIPVVEPYYEWVINKTECKTRQARRLKRVTYVDELQPYIERKLYIVNAEHTVTAYIGKVLGKQTIQDALKEERIYNFVKRLMEENARYLNKEYEMEEDELARFINKTLRRHSDPLITDKVERVGRSPIRKLGKEERLVGPLRKLARSGIVSTQGEKAVAFALTYTDSDDLESVELNMFIQENGVKETLKRYSQIEEEEQLKRIDKYYHLIQKDPFKILEESSC